MSFETDSGVFSRGEIDRGTRVLLEALPESLSGSVLDVGCGYGAIGVTLAKAYPACVVSMTDINERACGLARRNAERCGAAVSVFCGDGYDPIPAEERFDYIVQNPPIRAGKAVIYRMFADAARFLAKRGELWLVIRKQQGAPSALRCLAALYAQTDIITKESGYWVLRCALPLAHE